MRDEDARTTRGGRARPPRRPATRNPSKFLRLALERHGSRPSRSPPLPPPKTAARGAPERPTRRRGRRGARRGGAPPCGQTRAGGMTPKGDPRRGTPDGHPDTARQPTRTTSRDRDTLQEPAPETEEAADRGPGRGADGEQRRQRDGSCAPPNRVSPTTIRVVVFQLRQGVGRGAEGF